MNKILIIIILLLLLSIGLVSADLTDGLLHYYSFDNVTTDSVGSNDLANTGCTSVPTSGIIGGTYDYKDSGDYMQGTSLGSEISGLADLSINAWNNLNDNGGDLSFIMASTDGSGNHQILMYISTSNGVMYTISNTTIVSSPSSAIPVDGWTMITSVKTGTNLTLYINGIYSNSAVVSAKVITATNNFYVGRQDYLGSQGADGYIDELGIWNRSLSIDEIQDLYNSGSPTSAQQYPFNGSGPSTSYFNITAKNDYNDTTINTFNYLANNPDTRTEITNYLLPAATGNFLLNRTWSKLQYSYDGGAYSDFTAGCDLKYTNKIILYWVGGNLYCQKAVGGDIIASSYNASIGIDIKGSLNHVGWTTTGTITTNILNNDAETYNINIYATDYITRTYSSYDVANNLLAELHNTEISFNATALISNESINSTFTINAVEKNENEKFNLSIGSFEVLTNPIPSGYYNLNYSFNTTAKQIETLTVEGIYNNVLTVNITDIITNETVGVNSYLTVYNELYGYNETYNNNNGSFTVNLIQGNYSLTAWATDYAYSYDDIIINTTTYNYTVGLYANNSLWVTALDLDLLTSLTNFTVNVYDLNRSYVFNDNDTGTAKKEDIISGVYTVKITKSDYTTAQYPITITGGSHQNLVAYLQSGATETVFTVQDLISTGILEGATSNQYKLINSSYVLISSQLTDITGRVQFNYVAGNEYKFTISLDDYDTRTFLLTPLFSSYTIRLTPSTTEQVDTSGGDWIYYIAPNEFYNGEETNYTISISSGTGTLINYTLDVTYSFMGTTESEVCSNAYGCSYDYSVNVIGTSYDDYILVNYTVYETGRAAKTFSQKYYVIGGYNEYTLKSWSEEDATSGVGDLEKGFITTTILLIVIGAIATAASFVGAPPLTTSGIALTVLIFIMASVGFVPNYIAWVVGLGGLLMAIFGRGNY